MPDAQILNTVLTTYGISNPGSAGGGFNCWSIVGGVIFSIIGMYAFVYGRKEKSWRPMVIGIVLMVYPYFVPNAFFSFTIGIALTAALYYWRE